MDLVKNRKQIFWILQFSGWSFLGILHLFLYYREYLDKPFSIFLVLLTYIIGFLISLLLRYIYKRVPIQNRSFSYIALLVIGGAFFGSQLWQLIDFAISLQLPGGD